MAEQQAAQVAQEASNAGAWGFLTALATGALAVLKVSWWDKRSKGSKGPSLHTMIEQMNAAITELRTVQAARGVQMDRMEASMPKKEDLLQLELNLVREMNEKVGGVHERLSEHIQMTNKAA